MVYRAPNFTASDEGNACGHDGNLQKREIEARISRARKRHGGALTGNG
jgi:hypothetical protein